VFVLGNLGIRHTYQGTLRFVEVISSSYGNKIYKVIVGQTCSLNREDKKCVHDFFDIPTGKD
jgi:hypothetical protein